MNGGELLPRYLHFFIAFLLPLRDGGAGGAYMCPPPLSFFRERTKDSSQIFSLFDLYAMVHTRFLALGDDPGTSCLPLALT